MRSGKLIDISKSSLVTLKAELTRKKEEADQLKTTENYVKLPPQPKKLVKVNPGVAERRAKDEERQALTSEEIDLLKKSRQVLEIKASLYDQLQSGKLVAEDGESRYLVDFGRKSPVPSPSATSHTQQDLDELCSRLKEKTVENDDTAEPSVPINEEDWVDYTDCLGRTRKCHKSDLEAMRERDVSLSETLDKEPPKEIKTEEEEMKELVSHDVHLEMLRRKWEQKERELLDKKDIYYEDLLFDEARSHGVGYWKFSTDPEKRREEQEMLRKIREETELRQKDAKALRERRDKQRQARLIAARKRQRARLGLPPIEIEDMEEAKQPEKEEEEEEEVEEIEEDLEEKLKKAAHVRPWDKGKDGAGEPVMSQEEWNEKKRAERNSEFAPMYKEKRSKRRRAEPEIGPLPPSPEPAPSPSENPFIARTKNFLKRRNEAEPEEEPRKRAEIPPPLNFDYFTHTPPPSIKTTKNMSSFEAATAIDAGLRLLREQFEKSQNADPKGTYHINQFD